MADAASGAMATVVPHRNDVLFGKGTPINVHPGNVHFRSLVDARREKFRSAKRNCDKRAIANGIAEEIGRLVPPGRFLTVAQDGGGVGGGGQGGGASNVGSGEEASDIHPLILNKKWVPVEESKALDKIYHRLRDQKRTGGKEPKGAANGTAGEQRSSGRAAPRSGTGGATSVSPGARGDGAGERTVGLSPNVNEHGQNRGKSLLHGISSDNEKSHGGRSDHERNGPSPGISGQVEGHGGRSIMHGIGTAREAEGLPCNIRGQNEDGRPQTKPRSQLSSLLAEMLSGPSGGSARVHPTSAVEEKKEGEAHWNQPMASMSHARMVSGGSAMPAEMLASQGGARVHPSSGLEEKKESAYLEGDGGHMGRAAQILSRTHAGTDGGGVSMHGNEGKAALGGLAGPVGGANWVGEAHWQPLASTSAIEDKAPTRGILSPESELGIADDDAWKPASSKPDIEDKTPSRRTLSPESALDEEVDSFLRDFGAAHDGGPASSIPALSIPADAAALISLGVDCFQPIPDVEEVRELTLQEWIDRSRPKMPGGLVDKYVKSALPIALKLTECLLEADQEEKEGEGNPIPLASIVAENVLIRAKERCSTETLAKEEVHESIEYVWIMSQLGDNPDTGGTKPRLFALGSTLYHLFSAERHLLNDDVTATLPMSSIHLRDDVPRENGSRPPKKLQRQVLDCIAKLESMGIPSSLCALVGNLLDCSNGNLCGDDAYTSLDDVKMDLELMIDDPSRFLDNIPTNPIPSLSICDKMYGRSDEILKLEESYQQHASGRCRAVLISGGAGVGKSKLAVHVIQRLTKQSNGYFLMAKFDQNKHLNPLATVGAAFNSLCDQFARDAAPSQLQSVEQELVRSLGPQASLLAGIVPSLSKLMPALVQIETPSSCVDSALSMRFQFGELLRVISSHSRPISIVWDDIQWADSASLLLVGNLLSSIQGGSDGRSAFFTICHRDDAVSESGPFQAWLRSIDSFPLERNKLGSMSDEGVNQLVSDALHLSPRVTRPLSSVLHQKSGGNPFFLRQLMESLAEQSLIYVNLSPPRWAWELDKIASLKISDNVVALLVKEMQKLPLDLQLGLKVASCLGSSVKKSILLILSQDLKVDLVDILLKISQKGYMDSDVTSFCFAHDKIQQAAGKLMTEQERRGSHMRYGLALCSHTLETGTDDELFFVSVNQMNRGGPDAVHDPQQRTIIAQLNLNAGRRSIALSDYNSAFQLFEHGISFLGSDHWSSHYRLSIDLFDAAAEAACMLNLSEALPLYSKQVLTHAQCFDDKLTCLYTTAKALRHADRLRESVDLTVDILIQLGEESPRAMDDGKIDGDVQAMNAILQQTSDEWILNMKASTNTKIVTLLKVYENLVTALIHVEPARLRAVILRMVDISLKDGLTPMSPLSFALYGNTLVSCGDLEGGCRFGRLALKLVENEKLSIQKSSVIATVYQTILWTSEPLQSIASAHLLGHKSGQQSGDFMYSMLNLSLSIVTGYLAGQHLDSVQEDAKSFIREMDHVGARAFTPGVILVHSQTHVLKEGLHILEMDRVCDIPTESKLCADEGFARNGVAAINQKIRRLERAVLFHHLDRISLDVDIWDEVREKTHLLRPLLLSGIFLEGIACFYLARQRLNEKVMLVQRGDSILAKMKEWSGHSAWNWENKSSLLEAEKMHTLGNFDRAATMYASAICSARDHKFIHEEALASELAGIFFHQRGLPTNSAALLIHSIRCYKKWGALAVAKRVETFVANNFDPDFLQQVSSDETLDRIVASNEGASKKRSGQFCSHRSGESS